MYRRPEVWSRWAIVRRDRVQVRMGRVQVRMGVGSGEDGFGFR